MILKNHFFYNLFVIMNNIIKIIILIFDIITSKSKEILKE